MAKWCRYTEDMLREAVASSFCWADVCRLLGVKPATGAQTHLTKRAKLLDINSSHFKGKTWNKGKIFPKLQRPIEDYLNGIVSIGSHKLRLKLISCGLKKECCELCGISKWRGEKAPLELDHINSNHDDNRFENLQILCAMCHAQETSKRKNKQV